MPSFRPFGSLAHLVAGPPTCGARRRAVLSPCGALGDGHEPLAIPRGGRRDGQEIPQASRNKERPSAGGFRNRRKRRWPCASLRQGPLRPLHQLGVLGTVLGTAALSGAERDTNRSIAHTRKSALTAGFL